MSTPFEAIADLDRIVHEPGRLAILSALSACACADFVYLQRITGLSKGNLGSHLSRLEDAGLVTMTKEFVDRVPRTTVALTDDGRDRVEAYWRDLERLRRAARRWRPR
ncbi:MAG TPA: transcriptional regulator [Pilimelia sp.]|nr:transcriptional regulator [Pilimelia sp.]